MVAEMAIDPFGLCDSVPVGQFSSPVSKGEEPDVYTYHNFCPEDRLSPATFGAKRCNKFKKPNDQRSPYVYGGDKLQLLSRVTERKILRKKDYDKTFPANVYKANSDEFKANKKASNKKVRKSVLTIPNEQAPMPQSCTVSDVNEEYLKGQVEERKTRRVQNQTVYKKPRYRNKDYIFYDRDAKLCSQMNIDLDCSSTDMITHFGGDTKSSSKRSLNQKSQHNGELNAHDVWAVLRNINRFQFKPSPPDSNASYTQSKKKQSGKRRNNRKERRVIETCRTEEFAYIAKFEVDSRKSGNTVSGSSSVDRVTVINKTTNNVQKSSAYNEHSSNMKNVIHRPAIETKHANRDRNIYRNYKLSKEIEDEVNFKLESYKSREKIKSFLGSNHSSDNKDSMDSSNYNGHGRASGMVKPYITRFKERISRISDCKEKELISGKSVSTSNNYETKCDKDGKMPIAQESEQKYGMTKMILNHDTEKGSPKIDNKRKPRLITTMPSAAMMPKMTAADIKKRLTRIRFPLVILAKDQLSSSYEVYDYDPPQFNGLENSVWPFMVDWNKPIKDSHNNIRGRHNKLRMLNEERTHKKASSDIVPKVKSKLPTDNLVVRKKMDPKHTIQTTETSLPAQQLKKPKPMRQFKDKMLKLIYKKSNTKVPAPPEKLSAALENSDLVEKRLDTKETNTFIEKIDASTDTYTKIKTPKQIEVNRKKTVIPAASARINTKNVAVQRHPWSKVKWASEFIDSVIRKIKSGAYYSNEPDKNLNYEVGYKETYVQNDFNGYQEVKETFVSYPVPEPEPEQRVKEPLLIPGFGDALPAFEIKTLNFNQIAVKHRLTNVIVQFDVSVPLSTKIAVPESITAELCSVPIESMTCIPLTMTESHSKIFKSKTTIINAILPAEICSVLPKMMKHLMDMKNNSNSNLALPPYSNNKLESSPNFCESPNLQQAYPLSNFLPLKLNASIKRLLNGRFSNLKLKRPAEVFLGIHKLPLLNTSIHNTEFIPHVEHIFLECNISPMKFFMTSLSSAPSSLMEENLKAPCTALVPYSPPISQLVQGFEKFSFLNVIDKLMNFYNLNIRHLSAMFDWNTTPHWQEMQKCDQVLNTSWTICLNNLSTASIFDGAANASVEDIVKPETTPLLAIEYTSGNMPIQKIHQRNQMSTVCKSKRKGFVKLYKKCKSTSNIVGEKCSTSLTKISNLDEFFQALGSGKLLSSVFDGCGEKYILSSLKELKRWISDITPRQALLVLLLTNKKKTPNLVRYQPVLLQGIAVNRITRASELDMEIEVIERENLNKFPQIDGLTNTLTHADNQDSLFQELSWIAKTTASDYQRTYDESSEKLLKSLLAKRKRLNPSYLRVMARYVGLGLLKQSKI